MDKRALKTLEYDKIRAMLADCCVSEPGRVLAEGLLPLEDYTAVEKALEETQCAESIILRKGTSPVEPFDNPEELIKRARIGAALSMKELLLAARFLNSSRRTAAALETEEDTPVSWLAGAIYPLRQLEEEIFRIIISEDEMHDGASNALYQIRRQIRSCHERIREKLNSYIKKPELNKYLQDAIITMRGDRYVLPVKAENKGRVSGIVHDQSSSGATLFIEPMAVVEINNELRMLTAREHEEMERILQELSRQVKESADVIEGNLNALISLDFIFARAKLSVQLKCVRPQMNERGYVNIKNGRHPLIDKNKVVPVSVWLGDKFTVLLITGPNTGGKTVTLKIIGLFCLMAQSGLNVPADTGTQLSVFDNIFADIGDEQSIEQSLSTFSSHMSNISRIMKEITPRSLALFDELGAGTDPNEGASLAIAILEDIINLGARAAATTHYSELKAYSMTAQKMENASVEFDSVSLRPTYKLNVGVPGMSNALAISERLGLEPRLVQRARELLKAERVRFENVLLKAEEHLKEAQREQEEAALEKERAREERFEAEQFKAQLEKQKEKILAQARSEAAKIIEEADKKAKECIDELKALMDGANDQALIKMQTKRRALKADLDKKEYNRPKAGGNIKKEQLRVGETVFVHSLGQNAIVQSLPNAKGEIKVQAGILQMNVKLEDVSPAEAKAEAPVNTSRAVRGNLSVSTSLDVRGQTVDEACMYIDRYLDEAYMAHLNEVTIIHGKGTGALRSGIMKYLKGHPRVKEQRPGRYGEGEAGVTIVTLKQ